MLILLIPICPDGESINQISVSFICCQYQQELSSPQKVKLLYKTAKIESGVWKMDATILALSDIQPDQERVVDAQKILVGLR